MIALRGRIHVACFINMFLYGRLPMPGQDVVIENTPLFFSAQVWRCEIKAVQERKYRMNEEGNENKKAPIRSHCPVVAIDYREIDAAAGYGDARFIDIGQSTWNKGDFSAKVWRWSENGDRWSRQSEELPLSRVLDLATLVVATATGKQSRLQEFVQDKNQADALTGFIIENAQVLGPKLDELRRLLQMPALQHEMEKEPNLFDFATSELSQDAMFTWILSWANPECEKNDPSLHSIAVQFVKLLTGTDMLAVKKINASRQWEHIDIRAEINDDVFLAIEDKTGTTIHNDQLKRYKSIVNKKYPNHTKYFAYVKTGNEPKSILRKVSDLGYKIVLRKDIIDCLDGYTGENALLCEYRAHLKAQEKDTQSFRTNPVSKWTWSAWEGFYKELESNINIDNWSYVANPSGGFLAAWWHFIGFEKDFGNGEMYLQFEQGDLCFKICPSCKRETRSAVRDACHNLLMQNAKGRFPEIVRPDRFGAGEYMTIAKVKRDVFFGDGQIDVSSVVDKLKQYESLIDTCCQ